MSVMCKGRLAAAPQQGALHKHPSAPPLRALRKPGNVQSTRAVTTAWTVTFSELLRLLSPPRSLLAGFRIQGGPHTLQTLILDASQCLRVPGGAAPHLKPTSQQERWDRMVAKREVDVPLTASPGSPEPLTLPKKNIVVRPSAANKVGCCRTWQQCLHSAAACQGTAALFSRLSQSPSSLPPTKVHVM